MEDKWSKTFGYKNLPKGPLALVNHTSGQLKERIQLTKEERSRKEGRYTY